MFIYVFGGTASGKSRVAENLACTFSGERVYLATMENISDAAGERIEKHRRMRAGKGFVTVEKSNGLFALPLSGNVILLECVGNLLANTMFDGAIVHEIMYCVETVMTDIRHLLESNDLIVVGNDVFGEDGFTDGAYDLPTKNYILALKQIHERLIHDSDRCVEVVYGIGIERK